MKHPPSLRRVTKQSVCILLLVLLTSCNLSSPITRPTHDSPGIHRIQINKQWSQIGSFIFHCNGIDWIEFDSIISIHQQAGSFRAIGFNPVRHGYTTSTNSSTASPLADPVPDRQPVPKGSKNRRKNTN